MKRIEKARTAFESKDIEATKKAHSAKEIMSFIFVNYSYLFLHDA